MPFFDFEKEKKDKQPTIIPLKRHLSFVTYDTIYAIITTYITFSYFLQKKPLTIQNIYAIFGKSFVLQDNDIYTTFSLLKDLTQLQIDKLQDMLIDDIIFGLDELFCINSFIVNKNIKGFINKFGVVRDDDYQDKKVLCIDWYDSVSSQIKLLHCVNDKYHTENILLLNDKLLNQFIMSLDSIIDFVSPQYVAKINKIVSLEYIGNLTSYLQDINLHTILLDYLHNKTKVNMSAVCFILAIHSLLLLESPSKEITQLFNDILLSVNQLTNNYKFVTTQKVTLNGLATLYKQSPQAFEYYRLAIQLGLPKLVRLKTKERFLQTIDAIKNKGITYLLKKKQLNTNYLREVKAALHAEGITQFDKYLNLHKPVPLPTDYIQKAFRRLPKLVQKYNLKTTLNDLLFCNSYYKNKQQYSFLLSPFLFVMDDMWFMRNVITFNPYIKQKFSRDTIEYVLRALHITTVVTDSDTYNLDIERKFTDIVNALNSLVNMAIFFEKYAKQLQFVAFESYLNKIKYNRTKNKPYVYDDFIRDIIDYIKQISDDDNIIPRMFTSGSKYVKSFFRDYLSDTNQLLSGDKYFEIYNVWRNAHKRKNLRIVFFKRAIPKIVYDDCKSIQKIIESPSDSIFKLLLLTPACYNKLEALAEKEKKYFVLLQD